MSESKTRSVAAIGNSRVIPAQAAIQWRWFEREKTPLGSRIRGNDDTQ